MRLAILGCGVVVATLACGDGGGPGPEAAQLAFTVQPSTTVSGQALAPAVEVSVQDAAGARVGSAANSITLALESGSSATLGGTTTAAARNGVASFSDLRIDRRGTGYRLTASAAGLSSAQSAAFDVSPAHGVAERIAPASGAGQSAAVGEAVAVNPAVRVTDFFGDPVANVAVAFAVGVGGGSATGLQQTTGADGIATSGRWTLGTVVQPNTLLAAAAGLVGSPVTFTATSTPGAAATLSKAGGDGQTADHGTPVAEPPSVLVADAYGNPVSDVAVTFEVLSGGGNVTAAHQVSAGNGRATVGDWILGNSLGSNSLRATSFGLNGSPVTFTATATAPPMAATVNVANNYFRSLRNGSGGSGGFFGEAAVDTIAVGGSVTWQWSGQRHNATPHQNPAGTPLIASGTHSAPFTYGPITFSTAGVYRYRCTNHSSDQPSLGLIGMRGTIVVR